MQKHVLCRLPTRKPPIGDGFWPLCKLRKRYPNAQRFNSHTLGGNPRNDTTWRFIRARKRMKRKRRGNFLFTCVRAGEWAGGEGVALTGQATCMATGRAGKVCLGASLAENFIHPRIRLLYFNSWNEGKTIQKSPFVRMNGMTSLHWPNPQSGLRSLSLLKSTWEGNLMHEVWIMILGS